MINSKHIMTTSLPFVTTAMIMMLTLTPSSIVNAALQAGDNICVEGYVMDSFCIDRGTLMDNPSVQTLLNPELHSFHCLLDVPSCVESPFEILLEPNEPGQPFSRGFRLDDNSKAVALGKQVGICDTCADENGRKLGFRAVMNATIVNLNADDASIPPTLQIHAMEDTGTFVGDASGDSACLTYYGMEDIVDKSAEDEIVVVSNEPLQAGDNICVEGYVMDSFCIDRGTLLDNPSVQTLLNPELHSFHCLIDVPSCFGSPYEVLLDPKEPGDFYGRGWRLADNSQAIALGEQVGSCDTCADANGRKLGFRAVMNATIVNLNADDASIPPTLQIHAMEDVGAFAGDASGDSACLTYYGMEDIVDKFAEVEVVVDEPLQAGDNICVEGYVMDSFCIDRGTLLDNPSVQTLLNPELHSFHCLIDVPSCFGSPYEVLLDPKEPGDFYGRGWRLADNSQAIALGEQVGSCDTCADANGRKLGFRAVMNATIVNLNADDASIPPTLQIHAMEDVGAFAGDASGDSACLTYYGMKDVADKPSGGSTGGSLLDGLAVNSNASDSSKRSRLVKIYFAHGSLMILGWGFLLPAGTLIAKFFKHRPNGLWFKLHRGGQMLGLTLALIAFIIAVTNFNVFGDVGLISYYHGICGMVVMILGLLQPLNAFTRPHLPESPNEEKSKKRVAWEVWHKSSGWIAVALAIPTIAMGTLSLPSPEDQTKFQMGYGVGCGGALLLLIAFIFYDKKTFVQEEVEENEAKKVEAAAKEETADP